MTQAQLETGPGILGDRTRAAVSRLLEGRGELPSPGAPHRVTRAPEPSAPDAGHDTWFYIARGVETLESLAREWGVSVGHLLSHSDNHSLKEGQRKGQGVLRPGDRVAVPAHVKSKVQKSSTPHDPSVVDSLVEYLLHLTAEHPSSQGAKTQRTPAAKKAVKGASASKTAPAKLLPNQGYKKKHSRIWPDVVLNKSIESAFLVLLPYLPAATVMTSGYRSDADQARVINEYYEKHKGNPLEKNVEKRRLWLKKEKKLIIAKVGFSPHRTGYAFDLSGASIDVIDEAVKKCAKEHGDTFPLFNTIPERNQNCLHVNLDPAAVARRTS